MSLNLADNKIGDKGLDELTTIMGEYRPKLMKLSLLSTQISG